MAPATTTTTKTKSRSATKKSSKHHSRKGTQRESIAEDREAAEPSRTDHEPNKNDDDSGSSDDEDIASLQEGPTGEHTAVTPTATIYPVVNNTQAAWSAPGGYQSTLKMVHDSQQYTITKSEKTFDDKCNNWCSRILGLVSKQFFNSIQFITDHEEEAYGSYFQFLVCQKAEVDPKYAEQFWNRKLNGGMVTARAALNRRRMNTTNAMKKKFLGEYHIPQMQGLLAGCSMMLINCLIWC